MHIYVYNKSKKTCMVIINTKFKTVVTLGGGQEEKVSGEGTLGDLIIYI